MLEDGEGGRSSKRLSKNGRRNENKVGLKIYRQKEKKKSEKKSVPEGCGGGELNSKEISRGILSNLRLLLFI